jgi:5-formyltetrahydrofolate cyclo-ligase
MEPMAGASDAPLTAAVDKATLRKALLARRRALEPAQTAAWDAQIGARVLAWTRAHAPPTLGVYWALPGEVELAPVYAELARGGMRLALPVVLERHCALAFADWVPGEAMVKDRMGVAVPAQLRLVPRPGALLVPCLGFNAERFRLGYGGGFYDRTLAEAPRPLTAGVAYACLAAPFASAPHDVALDAILTEAG